MVRLPILGDVDPTNSVVPILGIEVTKSWQPKLGGTEVESVAPMCSGLAWVYLSLGITGTEWKVLVAPILDI